MLLAFWQASHTFPEEHSASVYMLEFYPENVVITSLRNADTTSQDVNSGENTKFQVNEVLRCCKLIKYRADERSIRQFATIVAPLTPRNK